MNTKLIAIAASQEFDLAKFKEFATKYQYRYGKIVGGFVRVKSEKTIPKLIKDFKNFTNPNRFLDADDVDGLTFMGWRSEVESMEAGCIVWSNKKTKDLIYATPNWDEENVVPFNIVLEGDEYGGYELLRLKFPDGMSLSKQKKLYLSTMKVVIESL